MTEKAQHVLICYGGKMGYYHGAMYQILKNFKWYKENQICVVTDKPHLFETYPARVVPLADNEMQTWSLSGANHFGIKIQGLLKAIMSADSHVNKSVLLDTDMYWNSNPNAVVGNISESAIVFYQDEGPIVGSKDRSIQLYEQALANLTVDYGYGQYNLLASSSRMWRSSLVGINHSQTQLLVEAFELFKALSPLVRAHTIEQFALGEIANKQRLKISTAKRYLNDWSSIGRKNYATPLLASFFERHKDDDFKTKLTYIPTLKLQRPPSIFLAQKISRLKTKIHFFSGS